MKEYFFRIHIEGMNGYLYYSVEAESEQDAVDMVDFYMQSAPHIIEKDTSDKNFKYDKFGKVIKEYA